MSIRFFRQERKAAMSLDHERLVTDYLHAVGEGRLDDLSDYLDADVTFDSPGMPASRGANEFVSALRRLAPIIAGHEIRRVFVDGDEAAVVYDFVTSTSVGAVSSFEWLTIKGDKIASIYLLFDKARWPEVVAELPGSPVGAER